MVDTDRRFVVNTEFLRISYYAHHSAPRFLVASLETFTDWILVGPEAPCQILVNDHCLLCILHIALIKQSSFDQRYSHRLKVTGTDKSFVRHHEVSRIPWYVSLDRDWTPRQGHGTHRQRVTGPDSLNSRQSFYSFG